MSWADEQRFRALYDRTYERVLAFVLRRVPDEDSAGDVLSDTYLAVWRRIKDVPHEDRAADAWVFRTARGMLANSRRGMKRRGNLFDRLRQRPVDLVTDPSEADEASLRVLRALATLKPAQQEILALAFWDDLDPDQISHVLGCTKNAAAVRLSRARQALEKALAATSLDGRDPPTENNSNNDDDGVADDENDGNDESEGGER